MIELTALQLVALVALAFMGFWNLMHWMFASIQAFMAPHVHIAVLAEELDDCRSILRATKAYIPTTNSEGADLHDAIDDLLNEPSDYKPR